MPFSFTISHVVVFVAGVVLTLGVIHGDRWLRSVEITINIEPKENIDTVAGVGEIPARATEEMSVVAKSFFTFSDITERFRMPSPDAFENAVVWRAQEEWETTAFVLPQAKKPAVAKKVTTATAPKPTAQIAAAVQTPTPPSPLETPTANALPEGIYQLPSGEYVDAYGNILNADAVLSGNYASPNPENQYFETPGGVLLDRHGNVVWRPEREKVLADPTVIDPDNLPEVGSVVYIPNFVSAPVTQNPFLTCTQHQFFENDRALCELYREQKDDYQWEVILYEE